MKRKRYSLSSKERIRYAGLLILDYMVNNNVAFPILLHGLDLNLEPILQDLRKKGFINIVNEKYLPTDKGRTKLDDFLSAYSNFLKEFEVFSAIDLESGEFAWSYYFDFDTDEEFQTYLNQERWEDLRFAVLEYQNDKKLLQGKSLNPVEMVFISFLEENRFDFSETNWQTKLLSGQIWDEILEICNSMLQWQDLGGEEVIKDIIEQGKQFAKELS